MSVQVSVEAINLAWKRVYNFERLAAVSFGNLKGVVQADDPTLPKGNQIYVYKGYIVNSDETLLFDPFVDGDVQHIELSLFVVTLDIQLPRNVGWKIDEPSVLAAKKYISVNGDAAQRLSLNEHQLKSLVDLVSEKALSAFQDLKSSSNASATAAAGTTAVGTDEVIAPPVHVPAVQAPPAPIVPAPVLPVVEWFQWGVMARLIFVAFLFTYNRNLNTEKLAHMAAMTLFSYLFQIGAFGFLLAWMCHKMGINFHPPMELVVPVPAAGPNPAVDGAAPVAVPAENGENGANAAGVDGNANAVAPVAGAAAQPAAIVAVGAPGVPPVAAARPAPLNAVQYLNQLGRDGFTIPTAPGIFLDVLSFFMGLIFSIVPSWAPYRLHR
eukprot:CAMPEP_0184984962 /NCGR_PEP_ID=MMETSP1098-20130426/13805_1 /TAXON_ID=89044 /ORGANISM="Spumella elongata, Strain CCAP 955/1" /LENGTH=381 /DNA_ID=CAMNT_0027509009 /DNA_START=99 /DNA_END=1244 /DNA_ORIENTATION=-